MSSFRGERRRLAHMNDAAHADRMLFLMQLSGRLDARDFTDAELREAEAALRIAPGDPQAVLPLPAGRTP